MATYVLSDIHGEYAMLRKMLEKINFSDQDTLYVLGDVIDRGPHPVKALQYLMQLPNAICLAGNHELMAVQALPFLFKDIQDISFDEDMDEMDSLMNWYYNGAKETLSELKQLRVPERVQVFEFMQNMLAYEEVQVSGKNYLLVHAGLGNFRPEKEMVDYTLGDLLWERADYSVQYFPDKYVVSGHTPTQLIDENPKPGFIYRANNHISIDCACSNELGRLACICLDTGEEFYIEHMN